MSDAPLEILLDRERIGRRVEELAAEISRDYDGENILLLCVLKGAIIFLADLLRNLTVSAEIDFIAASSYDGSASRGEVRLSPVFHADIAGRNILVVEDILDTGLTCSVLMRKIAAHGPADIKLCTLLDKCAARKVETRKPDYVGFAIPDKFVVGYGLDYCEKYRGLKDICILEA